MCYGGEAPVMLRFGQLRSDECSVSEKTAKAGVTITNTNRFDNLVTFKLFANNNPGMPKTIPV